MSDKGDIVGILAQLAGSPADEQLWRCLFKSLYPLITSVVVRRLRTNNEVTEDAIQEVFERLVTSNRILELRDPKSVRAYVWIVAENVGKDYQKAARKKRQRETSLHDSGDLHQIAEAESTGGMEEAFLIASRLDRSDQDMLFCMLAGLTLSEIAEKTGISYSAAGTRLSRLRRTIRNILKSQEK
jgi:RNA polymerase sigma factor (sigma-70 family)